MMNKGAGKGSHKAGGGKDGGGKGKKGGKGKGGKGKTEAVCGRCGGTDHHQSQCYKLADGVLCGICNKAGHEDSMCRTKKIVQVECGCCGGEHLRDDCPTWYTVCNLCGQTGHHDHYCHLYAQQAQQNQTWADKAKAVAPAKQQPPKPKLLPLSAPEWNAFCTKCNGGFNDPAGTLTKCPFCKSDLMVVGGSKAAATPSPFGALSQNTIQCQHRLDNVGPDGVVAKTKEDLEKEAEIVRLKSQVTSLESFCTSGGCDFTANILTLQKQIKELERKQISPDVQLLKDHSAIHFSLAELEQKNAKRKQQLQDQIAKELQARTDATTHGDQHIKDVQEEYRVKLELAKKVKAELEKQADANIVSLKQKLDDHVKETKIAIDTFVARGAPIMQAVATNAAAKSGSQAAMLAVAPGAIVHSNHLSAQTFLDAFTGMQGLGIAPEFLQQLAQACIGVVGQQAIQVPATTQQAHPPPPAVHLPPQQAQGSAQSSAMQQTAPPGTTDATGEVIHVGADRDEDDLTDMSDSEEECINANSDKAPVAKKKKGTRAAKKEKEEKKKKAASASSQIPIQKTTKK